MLMRRDEMSIDDNIIFIAVCIDSLVMISIEKSETNLTRTMNFVTDLSQISIAHIDLKGFCLGP